MTDQISPISTITQSSDLLIVERFGQCYKINVDDYGATCLPDDVFVVNRFGESYKCRFADLQSTCMDIDQFVINRGGTSYHVSWSELKNELSQEVTFTCRLQTPKKDFNKGNANEGNVFCSSPQSGSQKGGRLTCTVTALSSSTFTLENGALYIDGEWIAVCGSNGETGFKNEWFKDYYDYISNPPKYYWRTCHYYYLGTTSGGLSGVGQNNFGAGEPRNEWSNGNTNYDDRGSYGNNGAGGFGCPPGKAGAAGNGGNSSGGGAGGSQTRPRAENTGDTWNGITVVNATHSTGNWGGDAYIQYEGKTLRGSGTIGDLLT